MLRASYRPTHGVCLLQDTWPLANPASGGRAPTPPTPEGAGAGTGIGAHATLRFLAHPRASQADVLPAFLSQRGQLRLRRRDEWQVQACSPVFPTPVPVPLATVLAFPWPPHLWSGVSPAWSQQSRGCWGQGGLPLLAPPELDRVLSNNRVSWQAGVRL